MTTHVLLMQPCTSRLEPIGPVKGDGAAPPFWHIPVAARANHRDWLSTPPKSCRACSALVPAATEACPFCGGDLDAPEPPQPRPPRAVVPAGAEGDWHRVVASDYRLQQRLGRADVLAIAYRVPDLPAAVVEHWLFDGSPTARRWAQDRWAVRSHADRVPGTTADAAAWAATDLEAPAMIRLTTSPSAPGMFRVLDARFESENLVKERLAA